MDVHCFGVHSGVGAPGAVNSIGPPGVSPAPVRVIGVFKIVERAWVRVCCMVVALGWVCQPW